MKRITSKENKLQKELSIVVPAYVDLFILWLPRSVCFLHPGSIEQRSATYSLGEKNVIYSDQLKQLYGSVH